MSNPPSVTFVVYDPELVPGADEEKWERLRAEGGWVIRGGKVVARIEPGQFLTQEPPRPPAPSLREQILAELTGDDREQVADALLAVVEDYYYD